MNRAVLLGRVSTRKDSQAPSLKRQRAELGELAKRKGWRVVATFEDQSSGKTLDRPGLRGALDTLFQGKADVLVVHDLDRLGRNAREMLATVDALAAAGKGFYVRDREIDATGAMGRLVFTIFAGVAEYFRRELGEKVRRGLDHARKQGRIGGRPRSIDYRKIPRARALRRKATPWRIVARELGGTPGAWSRALSR